MKLKKIEVKHFLYLLFCYVSLCLKMVLRVIIEVVFLSVLNALVFSLDVERDTS